MRRTSVWGFLCLWILIVAGTGFAQQQYGHIRGVVIEEGSGPLPGATLTLHSEEYGSRTAISSEKGIFRLINLFPGTYSLRCEMPGFASYIREKIIIRVGTNFDLTISLKPAAIQEEATVIAESPIVDTKSTATAINFTFEMLQEIPSARDPYVILQQAPGIWVNSENVGGSQAGTFPYIESKGNWNSQNAFFIDGAEITDVTDLGYSPRPFDFDGYDEMQIVTSGADASIRNSGYSINLISKRGGNRFQGNARVFFTNHALQGDNRTQELEDIGYVGDQIDQILDYGFQFGGPIAKDKLWFWLGFGVQDNGSLTIDGYPYRRLMHGLNAKLNAQIHPKNRVELALIANFRSYKDYGAGPYRDESTNVDFWNNGIPFFKLEDEHSFSKNFLMSLKFSYTNQRWGLDPVGSMDEQRSYDLYTGVWSGTWPESETWRPDLSAQMDGNLFLENFLTGSHEIKFGLSFRTFRQWRLVQQPRDLIKRYWNGIPVQAFLFRDYLTDTGWERLAFYLNDALTFGRLTINLGLRLEREKGLIRETTIAPSESAPELFPSMNYPAIDPAIDYWSFSPRLGFIYNLTQDAKTVLRGSLARYAMAEGNWIVDKINPSTWNNALYQWTDTNGDDLVTTDELSGYPYSGILYFQGFDPWNPTAATSPNALSPDLKTGLIDEFLLGAERELFQDFSLRATLTMRKIYRFIWEYPYDKETGTEIHTEDYIGPITGSITYDGQTYNYQYWTLDQYKPVGVILKNNPSAAVKYWGFEMAAVKRFSHRWMMHASLTYQKDKDLPGDDPGDPTNTEFWWVASYGPQWMAKLSALYELPWGLKLSCFANARQGRVIKKELSIMTPERAAVGLGSPTYLQIEKFGTSRTQNFYNFDISLAKDFQFGRRGRLTIQVDAFNVFNFAHTLYKQSVINSARFNQPTRILNPRVIRLGIRYQY